MELEYSLSPVSMWIRHRYGVTTGGVMVEGQGTVLRLQRLHTETQKEFQDRLVQKAADVMEIVNVMRSATAPNTSV